MIDANSQFYAILTNVGMAKQANADALGIAWKITEMGVGDANPGGLVEPPNPIPSATQTKLLNEWRRKPLNQLKVDPINPAVIIAEQVIPADEGGYWIRELGLYDADGDLVAVANCAPSFKPVLSQGSGRTQVVRMNLIVSSTGNINLKIDPAVVLATREYVDNRIQEELYKLDSKQSVRLATMANIVLSGLQAIDGTALVEGDRVLVKNQTLAKDNGLWVASASAWKRAPDADSNAEVTSALIVSVEQGVTLADTRWQLVTDGAIVLGTTALTFQNVTQGFAPINSPALISPTANTPGQFDNSQLLVNSAFMKRVGVEYGDYTNYSASAVLTVADVGKVAAFATAGAAVATLPTGGNIPRGATVSILCGMGTLTVTAGAGEIVDAVNFIGNISLTQGDSAEFIRIGTLWRLIGGTAALKYAGVMSGQNWTTQAQFDVSKALATTEFVKRSGVEYGGYINYAVSSVLTLADVGRVAAFGSPGAALTATLPTGPGLTNGCTVTIFCVQGTVTATAAVGDTVGAVGAPGNIALAQGDTAVFVRIGTLWHLIGGSVSLKYAAVMAGANWQTPPQFDSSKLLATTEFVQRASGSYRGFTFLVSNTVLTAAALGTLVSTSGTFTVTLPAANTVAPGGAIHFRNVSGGVVTVVCAGTDSIYPGSIAPITAITMQPGATLELTCSGAGSWWASGSAQLQYSQVFGSTPAQFDNSKLLATTEFVQRAIGNKRSSTSITSSRSLTTADLGCEFVTSSSANISLTMPALSAVGDGASIRFVNLGVGRVTFTSPAGDCFIGAFNISGTATNFVLEYCDEISITKYAGLWLVVGVGSHAQSRAVNGYKRTSGGVIEQWGIWMSSSTAGAPVSVLFPLTFTGGVLSVQATPIAPTASGAEAWLDNNSNLNGFVGRANVAGAPVYWRALGY
ncbi:phage tail protein [Pseudomonas sp. efr-133-TYG-5]|uniref:phage tail protein n=1 Tax=Pseudomonas sp. efr-133-TYG-5 TaxID=3040310 RepID=UPI0025574E5B|nr:phage tail protein [Pseudomonas sp. efr-133-TYG-5]